MNLLKARNENVYYLTQPLRGSVGVAVIGLLQVLVLDTCFWPSVIYSNNMLFNVADITTDLLGWW